MPFYLTPEQDDSNQELQVCIAEALYDVDSILADPGVYTKEQLIISLTAFRPAVRPTIHTFCLGSHCYLGMKPAMLHIIATLVTGQGCQEGNMNIDTGAVIVIIGGWFVIGFLVALVFGKILRAANKLGSQRYHPSEHDNVVFLYFGALKHPVKLRTRGAASEIKEEGFEAGHRLALPS